MTNLRKTLLLPMALLALLGLVATGCGDDSTDESADTTAAAGATTTTAAAGLDIDYSTLSATLKPPARTLGRAGRLRCLRWLVRALESTRSPSQRRLCLEWGAQNGRDAAQDPGRD